MPFFKTPPRQSGMGASFIRTLLSTWTRNWTARAGPSAQGPGRAGLLWAARPMGRRAGLGRTEKFRPSSLFNIHLSSALNLRSPPSAHRPGRGFPVLLVGRAGNWMGRAGPGREAHRPCRAGGFGVRPILRGRVSGFWHALFVRKYILKHFLKLPSNCFCISSNKTYKL